MVTLIAVSFSALSLLVPAPTKQVQPTAKPVPEHVIARVHGSVPVLATPAGAKLATLGARTAFGSARVLSVVRRSGRWLRVTTADLPAGTDGWVDANTPGLTFTRTPLEITIELGTRTLELRRGDTLVRRFTVGIGAQSSPTPTGRFTVTDELSGPAYNAAYGCCILALSARQTHLPPGWSGGDRIAIHGTNAPATIGNALSSGCVHAADGDLRYLMSRVPLGTPVTIRR
jgi:lipoprotein-anchoring transpeptidase ErfK/SrfK